MAQRAGFSLKSFYRCFAGKDDLLVALLEEDSKLGAAILADIVDGHDDPTARLQAYLRGVFELLTLDGALGYAGVLVREHRRLSEDRPDQLAHALAPMTNLLADEVERAALTGAIASRDPRRDARRVFTLILDGIYDVALGRAEPLEEAESLWGFCTQGLAVPGGPRVNRQENDR